MGASLQFHTGSGGTERKKKKNSNPCDRYDKREDPKKSKGGGGCLEKKVLPLDAKIPSLDGREKAGPCQMGVSASSRRPKGNHLGKKEDKKRKQVPLKHEGGIGRCTCRATTPRADRTTLGRRNRKTRATGAGK